MQLTMHRSRHGRGWMRLMIYTKQGFSIVFTCLSWVSTSS